MTMLFSEIPMQSQIWSSIGVSFLKIEWKSRQFVLIPPEEITGVNRYSRCNSFYSTIRYCAFWRSRYTIKPSSGDRLFFIMAIPSLVAWNMYRGAVSFPITVLC